MEDDNKIVNFFMALILLIAILAFIGMAVLFVWGIIAMVKNGIFPILWGET